MVRLAVVSTAILGLWTCAALAGQASASFQVGIKIGGRAEQAVKAAIPLKTYTWGAAVISVNRAGFNRPRRLAKSDTLYWFEATRGGSIFKVAVSISSGKVVKVLPA